MIFREAFVVDIPQLSIVRLSVNENKLSNPDLITEKDYKEYLTIRGKGWLCEMEDKVVGFAIVDLVENNVWALFVLPEYEKKGIGKRLHTIMLDWYFTKTEQTIWLTTWPGTRAEFFYQKLGWKEVELLINGEIKFDLHYAGYLNKPNLE